QVVTLRGDDSLADVRRWLESRTTGTTHQGFPVLNERGVLIGVLTRRDLLAADSDVTQPVSRLVKRHVKFVYDDCTVRQAADHMVNHDIGRLPVVTRAQPHRLVGIITRSDVLSVFRSRIRERTAEEPSLRIHDLWRRPLKVQ